MNSTHRKTRRNSSRWGLVATLATTVCSGFAGGGCSAAPDAEASGEPLAETSAAVLTIAQRQTNMNKLYDMSNVLTVTVTIDPTVWQALKDEQPVGGVCNFDNLPSSARFQDRTAASVKIAGSAYPSSSLTYQDVEIKKKSFCGSFDTVKPSFKLKLPSNAEDSSLGTRYLVLNNSKQDPSFVRQPLAYKLYGMGGLPHSRANFARVLVYSSTTGTKLDDQVYVNVEPIRERYIDNPDNHFTNTTVSSGKVPGNLYELETDDIKSDRIQYIDVESISKYDDKKDLTVAATQIANGSASMQKVIDVDQFTKLFAMEMLLKHWDGYTWHLNNTYVYNDVAAVADPSAAQSQVRLKFIPWGVDQILQSPEMAGTDGNIVGSSLYFRLSKKSLVGKLFMEDSTLAAKVTQQIVNYRSVILGRSQLSGEIKAYIDLMATQLSGLGLNVTSDINVVRQQLDLARSAAYFFGGLGSATTAYVIDKSTGEVLHASSTETALNAGGSEYEVVHQSFQDSSADRWVFSKDSAVVTNEASGKYLHASDLVKTPAGHYILYTTPNLGVASGGNHGDLAQNYALVTEGTTDTGQGRELSGYLRLRNYYTGRYLKFGTDDPTPSGKQRVYQSTSGTLVRFW